ncbi:replication protein A, subunit RPA32 [Rickenella mellea]|uniref:Replication protein A, subunit RPA32 n=1 Tax=Rickenella mellea TaxID=50990 RepID=A0A4Y7Q2T4_9AGAM|nr:replication protein A, subunit RPA32 [Rickenella mellea]
MADYSGSPYYANLNNQPQGYIPGGSQYGSSQSSPGGSGRKAAQHSLRPVTLKQCQEVTQSHADAELFLDNHELGQLTVVAQVISIQSQTTNKVYYIDDGTARMEARYWMDTTDGSDNDKLDGANTENKYIRVTGTLKNFGNKRYITATHIKPLKEPYEIFFHLFDAMTVTLALQRGPPPKPGEASRAAAPGANGTTSASAYTSSAPTGAANDPFAGLPPLQRKIVEFIKAQPHSDEGVHVAAIARAVATDAHKISEALDQLMDDGHVFSTIDESHFCVS